MVAHGSFSLRKICVMASWCIRKIRHTVKSKEDIIMYQYNNNQYNPYGAFSQRPQASQSNLDWIMVQSVNQVENVAVSPCMKAWVMCQNEPIFALRTADAMGLVTTEYYRFEKVNPSEQQTEFVTDKQLREALDKFRGEINESIISARKSKSNVTAAEHD